MNIKPITEEEVAEAAQMYIMSVAAYIGLDKSAGEIAGAAHLVLSAMLQDLNEKHEQTITSGSGQIEGSEGNSTGPAEVPETRSAGRLEEGAQGVRQNEQKESPESPSEQREDAPAKS